jgi:hypothetical protein
MEGEPMALGEAEDADEVDGIAGEGIHRIC